MVSGFDPSSRLHLRTGDTAFCMGRTAIMPGGRTRDSMVYGVVHRAGDEVFTHIYLLPLAQRGNEVLLAAVFPGDDRHAAQQWAGRHLALVRPAAVEAPIREAA